jgi:4-carboxymuconolactone decarboxylase
MMDTVEEGFRRVTIGDPGFVAAMADREHPPALPRLDALTEALLRIAAMIAVDAPPSSYRAAVEAAQRSGARLGDLFAVLLAVAGDVGSARIVSAAPKVAMAAGYDVEAALE